MRNGDSDEVLMISVAAGDHRALRGLMDRHMGRMIGLAQRIVGAASDADEIAQEAFVRVWRHANRFDARKARFSTWLYRIVVNLALDRRRRPLTVGLEQAEDVVSLELTAEDHLVEKQRARLLDAALASLPDRQRAALVLFHFEGLSGRDAAAILDVSEKAFESLLTRGRAACRDYVAGQQKEYGDG